MEISLQILLRNGNRGARIEVSTAEDKAMCVITGENGVLFGVFSDRELAEQAVESYLENNFYYADDKSTIVGKKWQESFYFNSNVVLDRACLQ